jgi:hypothetical protein
MDLIKTVDLTLQSSSIPDDTTRPEWVSGTSYPLDFEVKVTDAGCHAPTMIYKSLVAANQGNAPATTPDRWREIEATNRWRMFDSFISTQSEAPSVGGAPAQIDVTFDCHNASTLSLFMLVGSTVQVIETDQRTGLVVLDTGPISLGNNSTSWSDYFFAPPSFRADVYIQLKLRWLTRIRLIITGDAVARCGHVVCGYATFIGDTQYGASVGIMDFSRYIRNDFGFVYLSKGLYAKKASLNIRVAKSLVNSVFRNLAAVCGTSVVFCEPGDYEPLLIRGFAKDSGLVIGNPTSSLLHIEIEGIT